MEAVQERKVVSWCGFLAVYCCPLSSLVSKAILQDLSLLWDPEEGLGRGMISHKRVLMCVCVCMCVCTPAGSLGMMVWGVEDSFSDLDLSVVPGAGI